MKVKFIVFALFFMSVLSTSAQEKVNQFNEKNERTGAWIKYYDNGKIRYKGQFEKGKEIGVFKFYSMVSSKHPVIVKTYSDITNISTVKFYTEEGVLKSSGEMIGEERAGKWLYYFNDGNSIVSEENYSNGLLNGESKTFYKNGKITEILQYTDGLLDGNIKQFSDEGILLEDLNYTKGILNGMAKYYDPKGALTYTGMYKNNIKIGKWEYFENGVPVSSDKLKQ